MDTYTKNICNIKNCENKMIGNEKNMGKELHKEYDIPIRGSRDTINICNDHFTDMYSKYKEYKLKNSFDIIIRPYHYFCYEEEVKFLRVDLDTRYGYNNDINVVYNRLSSVNSLKDYYNSNGHLHWIYLQLSAIIYTIYTKKI